MLANARSRSKSLTSLTWSNLANALLTWDASVIGSLRAFANVKHDCGIESISAAEGRPCNLRSQGFHVGCCKLHPLVLETIHPSSARCKRKFARLFDHALGFGMTEVTINFRHISLTLAFNSAVFGSVRHSASAGRMSTPDLPSACSSNLCKRLSSCLLGQPGRSHAKLWPACRIFVLPFLEDLLRSLQNPKFWKTALVHFLCDR
jgi:hypothetical protein